jgi:hypothetical protein
MAKTTRTKEIWHIPKRGNVHQTIYMVYVLSWDRFLGKSWSSGKQEALGTEMGKAGLTESGKAITHQSVRTLLANLPKYLGFVYLDESSTPSRIMVTDIGYELIKKHDIPNIPKHKKLKAYADNGDLVETSEIFQKQMSKLIITNPSIRKDCENILVFPFRMTLKVLLKLEYLDMEEIGYILFHTKAEDELDLVVERIKNFRALPPAQRNAEINAYKKTDEGQLTLVKAPTAGYYMYLCTSTGLCNRYRVEVNKTRDKRLSAIKLKDKTEDMKIIEKFKDVEIFDFKDDWFLWKEYFANPQRLYPPFNVSILTNNQEDVLVTVMKNDYIYGSEVISKERSTLLVPVFRDEAYKIIGYDLESGKEVYKREVSFSQGQKDYTVDLDMHRHGPKLTKENVVEKIEQMFSGKYQGFDKDYSKKLEIISAVVGKNYLDNRRRGGRLEYLFYELLELLKRESIIDEVYWYGGMGKYGICEPAPGGKEGNPDIVFEIDSYMIVLEITAFRGNRAQWNSAEASSVPDHIAKFKRNNPSKNIIGLFTAPSIHHQLEQNLKLNAQKEKVGMIFKPCIEFAKYLTTVNKKALKELLVEGADRQIGTVGKSDLFFSDVIPDEEMVKKNKYSTHLPVYSLQAVATAFSEEQKPELLGWKKIKTRKTLDKHMFIAQVVGRSMEPTIRDGSYCIFRFDQGGTRNGKVVLVESRQVTDPETNQKFTVKRYHSEKEKVEVDQWRQKKIVLSPDNKEFDDIILENVSEGDFHVVAEFIAVI